MFPAQKDAQTQSLWPNQLPGMLRARRGSGAWWAAPPSCSPGACGWGFTVSTQGPGKSQGRPWEQPWSYRGFSRRGWAGGSGLKAQVPPSSEAGRTVHAYFLLLWTLGVCLGPRGQAGRWAEPGARGGLSWAGLGGWAGPAGWVGVQEPLPLFWCKGNLDVFLRLRDRAVSSGPGRGL